MTASAVTPFEWRTRPAVSTDLPYVIKTWGESSRSTYPHTATSEFWRGLREHVYEVIDAGCSIVVAHPPDAPELIWGWACLTPGLVHYVYVRRALRSLGIARDLCGTNVTTYTRLTADARKIKEKHGGITVLPRF